MTRAVILPAACLVLACAATAATVAWRMTVDQIERERALPASGEGECAARVAAARAEGKAEWLEGWLRTVAENRRQVGGPAR